MSIVRCSDILTVTSRTVAAARLAAADREASSRILIGPSCKSLYGAAMPIRTVLAFCLFAACGSKNSNPATTAAPAGCPPAVPAAVTKAFPDATQVPCESETEDGMTIYEIKIKKTDGSLVEIELSADGSIIATEEVVSSMPDAVSKAFAAKYPGATASRIEKITSPAKPVMFEVTFDRKEATFSEAGDFVEEEKGEGDDKDGKEERDDD